MYFQSLSLLLCFCVFLCLLSLSFPFSLFFSLFFSLKSLGFSFFLIFGKPSNELINWTCFLERSFESIIFKNDYFSGRCRHVFHARGPPTTRRPRRNTISDDDDDHHDDDDDDDDQHDAAFRAAALDFLPRTKKKGWFFDRIIIRRSSFLLSAKKTTTKTTTPTTKRGAGKMSSKSRRGDGDKATKEHTIFWDLDDCLYKNDWKVANLLTARIEEFTVGKLDCNPDTRTSCIKNTARA